MRAVQMTGERMLSVVEMDAPEPDGESVIIKVSLAGSVERTCMYGKRRGIRESYLDMNMSARLLIPGLMKISRRETG